jgi:hypothetical protein
MFPLLPAIAALVAQATQAQATQAPTVQAPASGPRTLAGVALGVPLPDAVARDPATKQFPNPLGKGTISKWNRKGAGGTVTVVTNADGVATRIEFVADDKEHDSVDLPCASAFSLDAPVAALDAAAEKANCKALDAGTYRVPDGSILDVQFGAAAGAPLLEAIWYRGDGR